MNLLPLSLNPLRQCYLPAIMLTLMTSATLIPVKAQSQTPPATVQIAQSLTDAQQKTLTTKAEQIIQLLIKQDYTKARGSLSPELQVILTPEKIKTFWEDTLTQTGEIKKVLSTNVIQGINANVVVVTVETTQGKKDFFLTFNPQQQVIGLNAPTNETPAELAEEFTYALIAKDYIEARKYLHPFLKAELFPQEIQQKWEALLKKTGAVKRIVRTDLRRGGGGKDVDIVLVTLQFAQGTEDLFVLVDNNKQIVGVDFPEMQ